MGTWSLLALTTFLELAEMELQKEEVLRLEKELSEAEEILEKERAKSKGKLELEESSLLIL